MAQAQLTSETPTSHLSTPRSSTPATSQTPGTPTTTKATTPSQLSHHAPQQPSPDQSQPAAFRYPPHHSFPPFYTLQPNLTTRASQLSSWSSLLLTYCSFHRLFYLHASHAVFSNPSLRRTLPADDAAEVFSYMAERGRATFTSGAQVGGKKKDTARGERGDAAAYVWWKTAEQWAGIITQWIEDTGQKGSVLTLYELLKGEAAERNEWHGMPEEMLRAVLGTLVKKGKASVFGEEEAAGVKFY